MPGLGRFSWLLGKIGFWHGWYFPMKALFGGTFNPVHNGHIALAREVVAAFGLDGVELVPSFMPVHRDEPQTAPEMRERLVELAIAPYPELRLNRCEIERQGPSYSFDTLAVEKAVEPGQSLCWLLGADAFNDFLSWKNPRGILELANLIVCARPGILIERTIFPEHYLQPGESLKDFSSGKIAFFEMQPNTCRATRIRAQLASGDASVADCLSPAVLEFIRQHHLYST